MSGLDFVISDWGNNIILTQTASLLGASIPSLGTGIRTVYEVDTQVFRDTFQYHVDSEDLNDDNLTTSGNLGDIKYYVDNNHFKGTSSVNKNWPDGYIINPTNSTTSYANNIDTTFTIPSSGGSYSKNKSLVKHDYLRWIAFKLFGTHYGVDLFNNEFTMLEEIAKQGHNIYEQFIKYKLDYINTDSTNSCMVTENKTIDTNIYNYTSGTTVVAANYMTGVSGSGNTYAGSGTTTTYGPSTTDNVSNICKTLFDQMLHAQPERFQDISGGSPYAPNTNGRTGENYLGDGKYERIPLPFIAGDTISFSITLKPNSGQASITNNSALSDSDLNRTYIIKLLLTDSAINNTHPSDINKNTNGTITNSSYLTSYISPTQQFSQMMSGLTYAMYGGNIDVFVNDFHLICDFKQKYVNDSGTWTVKDWSYVKAELETAAGSSLTDAQAETNLRASLTNVANSVDLTNTKINYTGSSYVLEIIPAGTDKIYYKGSLTNIPGTATSITWRLTYTTAGNTATKYTTILFGTYSGLNYTISPIVSNYATVFSIDGTSNLVTGNVLKNFTTFTLSEPTLNYTEYTESSVNWGLMTINNTHRGSLDTAITESGWATATQNLKILGNGSGAQWNDFKFSYGTASHGKPDKMHIENVSLITTSVDSYAVYSRDTKTTMKDITISGYSGNSGETGGGAMRIRAADYSGESHSSSSPTLENVTISNCCRGIRIQDSISAYVKDCPVTNVTDNGVYFASGSYTSSAGCTNCTADNCNVTTAGQVAYMNIGGSGNKFINSTMNGSRGAAVGIYNTNGQIEVTNCSFTNANTSETTTPYGGNTDEFGGSACGMSVNVGDTNGKLVVSNSTFISGNDSVFWKSAPGTMEVSNNTVTLANFPGGLVDSESSTITGV
jgi:hypothetical protein